MLALLQSALAMGWPLLLLLALFVVYLRVRTRDAALQRQALSKGAAALLALMLLLIAVANVRLNFFGDTRLLPLSLALITAGSFLMAVYFVRVHALFKIGALMFLVALFIAPLFGAIPSAATAPAIPASAAFITVRISAVDSASRRPDSGCERSVSKSSSMADQQKERPVAGAR